MHHRFAVYLSLSLMVLCGVRALRAQGQAGSAFPAGGRLAAEFARTSLPATFGEFFAADKTRHFMGSLIATVFFYKILEDPLQVDADRSRIYAAGATLTLGISKEWYDRSRPGNRFSWKDLLADVLGIAGGLIIANQP